MKSRKRYAFWRHRELQYFLGRPVFEMATVALQHSQRGLSASLTGATVTAANVRQLGSS